MPDMPERKSAIMTDRLKVGSAQAIDGEKVVLVIEADTPREIVLALNPAVAREAGAALAAAADEILAKRPHKPPARH